MYCCTVMYCTCGNNRVGVGIEQRDSLRDGLSRVEGQYCTVQNSEQSKFTVHRQTE